MSPSELPQLATVIPPATMHLYRASFFLAMFAFVCVLPLILSDLRRTYASYLMRRSHMGRLKVVLGLQTIFASIFLLSCYLWTVEYRLFYMLYPDLAVGLNHLSPIQFYLMGGLMFSIGLLYVLSVLPFVWLAIYTIVHINYSKIPLRNYVYLVCAFFIIQLLLNLIFRSPKPNFGYPPYYFEQNFFILTSSLYLVRIVLLPSNPVQNLLKLLTVVCITISVVSAFTPPIIEQYVFKGKICVGITCPFRKGIEMRWKLPPEYKK